MKKIFLMGRSEAGKTSLTQALKGEELHYHKTQYTNTNEDTIDSPGEYAESKHFSVGLACFSFEADVIAIVQAANEPFNLFSDGSRNFLLRPLIGIITKVDSPHANIPMVRQWMENMGCERIFMVNNKTREGISELMVNRRNSSRVLALTNGIPCRKGWSIRSPYGKIVIFMKNE